MSVVSAEDIFYDYCGRRRAILKALTTEADAFYEQCSPERENLCLYGNSDGTWDVGLPCEEVPPELPEPALGINFSRDGMKRGDWLALVAVHSDCWLLAVAFFNGARLDAEGRRQLFNNINTLPTSFEVVTGRAQHNKPPAGGVQVGKRAAPAAPPVAVAPAAVAAVAEPRGRGVKRSRRDVGVRKPERAESDEEDDDEDEEAGAASVDKTEPCPNCGRLYRRGEFWIACDGCDRWFDGRCVGMTPQKAEKDSEWRCPGCSRPG